MCIYIYCSQCLQSLLVTSFYHCKISLKVVRYSWDWVCMLSILRLIFMCWERVLFLAGSETVAGEILHNGITDKAPSGDPWACVERGGVLAVPSGHTALPAVLSPSQPATLGGRRASVQPRPLSLPHPGAPGSSCWSFQVHYGVTPKNENRKWQFCHQLLTLSLFQTHKN